MAKFFGNLHLVLVVGVVLAIVVMVAFAGDPSAGAPVDVNSVFHWLHVFFGILWIGLLYYFNFVQVPTMPKVPAELKKGVTGYIAPSALFFFRYAALLTVITGLVIAINGGFAHEAFTFTGGGKQKLIGLGMYLAIIMFLNVWLVIWPNQKKILGIVEATDEEKAKATPRAMIASRINTLLSLPMIYCMVSANIS